ncbi:anaphase-promoting complex subunit Cut9 [Marasmius tenuissimus]|nr:anaphase-promoting complex subunit Cut9 [Marasmius tenuissimus]
MTSTPPPSAHFAIPAIPHIPTPSGSRHRGSINSSFSFGPQHLIDTYNDANSSYSHHNPSIALDPNRSILQVSPLRSSPRRQRKTKESIAGGRHPHPLANDTTGVFQDSEDDADDEDEYEWGMIDRMRLWRHDALMQHLYETAAFWGDKIMTWSNDPNDAFWLAQTYFMQHQYSRAERLLTRAFPTSPPRLPATPPLNLTNGDMSSYKGKGREQDLLSSTIPISRIPMGPTGVLDHSEDLHGPVSRLVDMSVACRYLAAQCQVRQGNWAGATEMLGEANPFRDSGRSGPTVPNIDGGIKIEASMCHLRGLLMLKMNKADQAKHCFMEALALDVKCYDAFDQLVSGEMLSPEEEWEFVQGLSYSSQTPQDASFIQMMYTTRLRKYKHVEEQALTRRRLVEEYGLGDNPDLLFSFADALYTNFRWSDCFVITSRILSLVTIHNPTMPLHLACMYHLKHLHSKLFLLAHEMVESEPENPISWYAVGVWYLSHKNWVSARQYFSKTSLMDPRFGPAWIAFGHTFSNEGEHDHAVTAYSTAARMFPGSHIPLTFVGMEQIVLSNFKLADEALAAAHSMCDGDALVYNERGVMAYNHGQYKAAAEMFEKALSLAEVTQSSQQTWTTTYINLGTCYRRLKCYPEARETYRKVLALDPQQSLALGFLGLVNHLTGDLEGAIVKYHEALSVDPINAYIMELLNIALESASAQTLEAVAMAKVKEQIRVQSERLQEKYRRGVPQAKELFEKPPSWLTKPDGTGTAENSLDVEDMSVG